MLGKTLVMSDPVIVREDSGSGAASFGIIAVLVVAVFIGLFVWHPWSVTTTHQTTVTQPGAPGNGGSTTNSTTNSTTTTTNGHP